MSQKDDGALSPMALFEILREEGEAEIQRPITALWFSGLAAGLLISFSVLGEAFLRAHLPDTPWRFVIENFGYTFGFLLVILGRMQLFTENTITTVVPVVSSMKWETFLKSSRLWGVVLLANVIGAFLVALFLAYTPLLSESVFNAAIELSKHATGYPPYESFIRGIPAGVLIAALVWMMPTVNMSPVSLVVLFTWLIAMGDFTHIIAGSVEMAFLMVQGELAFVPAVTGFFIPVLFGNVVGGTVVFTILTWAQIKAEVVGKSKTQK